MTELVPTTQYALQVEDKDNSLIRDCKSLSEKGLYCFDISDKTGIDYEIISYPEKPIKVDSLPKNIYAIMQLNNMNISFAGASGNVVEYGGELSTSKKTKSGNVIRKITGFYDIETTETRCHLLFMSTVQDEGNENAEGILIIVYVTDELFQSEDFYWQYGNREPGIYIDTKMLE